MQVRILTLFYLMFCSLYAVAQDKNQPEYVSSEKDKGYVNNYFKKDKPKPVDSQNKTAVKYPYINVGVALQVITSISQAEKSDAPGASSYNFQPGDFKYGFLHSDAFISDKLSAGFSLSVHSTSTNKISDAYLKYIPFSFLGFQVGRFKGAGNRAVIETSTYDVDFADMSYVGVMQTQDLGTSDYRFNGLNVFGNYKWLRYSFFLHKSNNLRSRAWTQNNNDPVEGNGGVDFKSWDFSLRFTPVKFLEFGGHMSSSSQQGVGGRSRPAYSGFAYYITPHKLKVKIDYVFHYRPIFEEGTRPPANDYTLHNWHAEKKQGVSALAGHFVSKHIEPMARFEHFYEGKEAAIGYKYLNLYTLGLNYYPFPDSPRVGKVTVFFQKRDEKGGLKLRNDWFGIQYQMVLFGKAFAG